MISKLIRNMRIQRKTLLAFVTLICCVYAIPTEQLCARCSPEECAEDPTITCCKLCLAHIKCSPKEMVISIPRASAQLAIADFSFADSKCGGKVNETHYIFRTSLTECGTKSVFIRNTHVLYKNEIRHRNGSPLYALTCLFKRRVRSLKRSIKVKTPYRNATRMYHTSVRGRRKNGNAVYADDNEHVFFEIKGPTYLRERKMQMAVKSCQFDITQNSNVPNAIPNTKDVLIRNGCPTRPEVQTLLKTQYTLWFSVYIDSVKQDRNDTAVLNCDIVLCYMSANKKCKFTC